VDSERHAAVKWSPLAKQGSERSDAGDLNDAHSSDGRNKISGLVRRMRSGDARERALAAYLEAYERTMNFLFRIGMFRSLWRSARLSWRLVRDPRTPTGLKLLLAGAVLLIVSPVNWIPNFIPVLGQMEDVALLALALNLFLKGVPPELKAEHEAALE
jgi:uncharacterized membrane protein YkvA (DUF1232 family)